MKKTLLCLFLLLIPWMAVGEEYPEEVKDAFIEGCSRNAPMDRCACTLDALETSLPLETLEAGQGEAALKLAVQSCSEDKNALSLKEEERTTFLQQCARSARERDCICVAEELKKYSFSLSELNTALTTCTSKDP